MLALRPACASWMAGTAPWPFRKEAILRKPAMWASSQMPVSPCVMRPRFSTAVASTNTAPAPPCANLPRCTRCQSATMPSCAEYWHIGEMTMRLRRRTPRSSSGWKRNGGTIARLCRRTAGMRIPRLAAAGRARALGLEQLEQQQRIGGLHDVQLAADRVGARAVIFLRVAGHRDEARGVEAGLAFQLAAHVEAVDSRQAEIEEHHLGTEAPRDVERRIAVDGQLDLVALLAQDEGEAVQRIEMVFDHQDAPRSPRAFAASGLELGVHHDLSPPLRLLLQGWRLVRAPGRPGFTRGCAHGVAPPRAGQVASPSKVA